MEESDESKLFVGGISWQTTDSTMKEHFEKYGTVVRCVIAKDRSSGTPRGFGFVCFSDPSAVDKALQDTHEILGRTVEVKKAIPRSDNPQNQSQVRGLNRNSRNNGRSSHQSRTKKIFVGGLSANLTEKEFRSYFEQFGGITDVVVMHDNVTHRPRGFGFITFDSEDSVENVMQKNFHELGGKLVEVKRAVPKEGNGNGNNVYDGRLSGGGPSIWNDYDHGNFQIYSATYGMLPGYGPYSACGGFAGYSYTGAFTGCYPPGGYNAIGYGVAPVGPSGPWSGNSMFSFRGTPMVNDGAATVYAPYLSGGVGSMGGFASGGFTGNVRIGGNGKLSDFGYDNQVASNRTPGSTEKASIDANSSRSGRSYNAAPSRQNQRVNDGNLADY